MREMKYSGVEWIGDIPEEWEVKPIRNILIERNEKNRELSITTILSLSAREGVSLYNSETHTGNKPREDLSDYKIVRKGDIVVNSMNILSGSVGISEYEGVVSPVYYIYYPRTNNNIRYFHLLFQCFEFQRSLRGLGNGILIRETESGSLNTIRIRIPSKKLGLQEFPYPSEKEQQAIADILDRKCTQIDALIANEEQQIAKLKAYKQSVITETVTKGLNPDVPMKDSGVEWIGEIPEIWSIRKLRSFANIISKGTTPKNMSQNFDDVFSIRYLKSENIVDNHLSYYPNFYIEKSVHEGELSRSILSKNDLLFVIAGASIGKVAIMDEKLLPANTNQAVSFIRINEKYKNIISFIWYYLQSDLMKRYIQLFAVQSAQPNISMENLGYFPVVFTEDRKMIGEIVDYLDQKCEQIDRLITIKQQKIEKIQQYKKSVIYEYVTGKREVST